METASGLLPIQRHAGMSAQHMHLVISPGMLALREAIQIITADSGGFPGWPIKLPICLGGKRERHRYFKGCAQID